MASRYQWRASPAGKRVANSQNIHFVFGLWQLRWDSAVDIFALQTQTENQVWRKHSAWHEHKSEYKFWANYHLHRLGEGKLPTSSLALSSSAGENGSQWSSAAKRTKSSSPIMTFCSQMFDQRMSLRWLKLMILYERKQAGNLAPFILSWKILLHFFFGTE